MRFEDRNIKSVGELVGLLQGDTTDLDLPVWFRGQANIAWNLEPKVMRIDPIPSESHYLNKFKQDASIILSRRPENEFEWLFLMQHYGVATRLLDWSESPLVGLYFALINNYDDDGALWVLLPTELNKISNYKPDFESEIPSFEDEHLKNYLPSTIAQERKSSLQPMAAIAPRNSSRMQAQQGVFTIGHRENILIEQAGHEGTPKNHIWRYIISADVKAQLIKQLKLLSFSKFQLFPELDSLSSNFE